jgi:hypothetical protein
MRITAVSDLHGFLPRIEPCDLLLLGGDLCPVNDHAVPSQVAWLDGPFRAWLDRVPAAEVIGVAGNHDFVFQKAPLLVPSGLRWTYLEDAGTTSFGLKVYGLPWQPEFGGWAFNAKPNKMREVAEKIPDVLVMHGPPRGFGDLVSRVTWPGGWAGCGSKVVQESAGCPHLCKRVRAIAGLRLAVYGHIHSGHGVYRIGRRGSGDTLLANVSLLDERYAPVYGVTVFDCDPDTKAIVARPQYPAVEA